MTTPFLWPEGRLHRGALLRSAGMEQVEAALAQTYPGTHPVLFSSARAALSAALESLGLRRSDLIWCPPFSSHCVLEAVARVGTPTPTAQSYHAAAIVFHQWGYTHSWSGGGWIIEDAADSLIPPGTMNFPNDGAFQIVSLPKVFSCAAGGAAFCRAGEDAERLRRLRDARPGRGWLQFLLRMAMTHSGAALRYWQGVEAGNGRLPGLACADILFALERIEAIVEDRREKLILARQLAPSWLRVPEDRLPCVMPLEHSGTAAKQLRLAGMSTDPRHFNRGQDATQPDLVKVLPLPIHQQISFEVLHQIVEGLRL